MEAVAHERQVDSAQKATEAAGVGATDGEDHQAEERDADGRRLWEVAARKPAAAVGEEPTPPPRLPKDASGLAGNQIDLAG